MPPKSRHCNRGSRSFLSSDLLQSIAKGRLYQTVETSVSNFDFRSQSSLSCDPNAQYQSSNERTEHLRHGLTVSSSTSYSASRHDVDSDFQASIVGTISDGISRYRKRKRLPWVPESWSRMLKDGKQGSSTTIPPTTSMSSISKSSISSPVLTSTTNARVADAEKVQCSEVLFPISSLPEHHYRYDDVPGASESSTTRGIDNISSWTSSVRSIKAKLGHARRESTGPFLTSSWSKRTYARWESAGSSSISSRRKAKLTVKGKLHHLGRRLHILPAQTDNDVVYAVESVKAKEIQPHQSDQASRTTTPRATPFLSGLHSDSTTDLLRGSLSRSFASAVDKLDLRSSPTLVYYSPSMSTLRKAKSFIGLKDKYDSDDKGSSQSKTTPSKPLKADVSKLSRKENKTQVFDCPTPEGRSQTQPDKEVVEVTAQDHPHPLLSHPNVTGFAFPGQIQAPITPDAQVTQSVDKGFAGTGDDDDKADKDHRLSEGFTASESTGEISHHTRTPTPVVRVVESEPIKARVPAETPTKQPAFKRLKKSVSGFFTRSASMMRLTANTAATNTPTANTTTAGTPTVITPARKSTIQEGSEPQETGIGGVEVPKRVVHDHQPVTPSPLRNSSRPDVSRASHGGTEEEMAVSTATQTSDGIVDMYGPRSPRSAVNPEKRRAMYGDSFKGFRASRIDLTKAFEE